MRNTDTARAVIFRALLGEEPLPTKAEITQARAMLAHNVAFHQAFAQLLDVILRGDHTARQVWRERMQAYITAQLAGPVDLAEFADVRQALDASVELAEEYALLYETLQAEAQGLLPIPHEISPADLNFLPQSAPQPTALVRRTSIPAQVAHLLRGLTRRLHGEPTPRAYWGRLGQMVTGALLVIMLGAGLWAMTGPKRHVTLGDLTQSVSPTSAVATTVAGRNDPSGPESQIIQWSVLDAPQTGADESLPNTACLKKECPL